MGSVFYHEDGWIAEVLVLEDLGDREREAYRLEVVRTLQAPPVTRPSRSFASPERRCLVPPDDHVSVGP